MPRKANKQPTVRITITTSARVAEHLTTLVGLGLYGATLAEVAEQLVCESLRNDLRRKRTALLTQ